MGMDMKRKLRESACLVAFTFLLASCASPSSQSTSDVSAPQTGEPKVSAPNQYSGYSTKRFDGYERSSFYIPVRDGTRLAVDLFRPTLDGELVDDKLPVVWMHTPYNRRSYRGQPAAEAYPGYALELVPYGYNVAVVDFRGVYASFGKNIGYNRGEWVEAAKWDAYDITEWFADQSYSNGNIGMWGCSATGGSQMQALTTTPPSLKAVIPMSAELDAYAFAMSGGVPRGQAISTPGSTASQDMIRRRDIMAVAVDGPEAETLLEQAKAEHEQNIESVGQVDFRDSLSPSTGFEWWAVSSPHTYLDDLKSANTGVMVVANWDEAGTCHGSFLTFNNLNPENVKLLAGPSTHCAWSDVEEKTGFNLVTEELRFYDHWLKGVDNNVMSEPAVTYYTYNAPDDAAWRQSEVWPLADEVRTPFYLTPENRLQETAATGQTEAVDFAMTEPPLAQTVTLGPSEGGALFETEPLEQAIEVTGHPVANLWISSDQPDADVTVYIHDVAPDGSKQSYQMLGRLRASRRAIAEAPFDNLGLPWHSHTIEDAAPIPEGQAVELAIELFPMSYIFQKGHKIQVQVAASSPDAETQNGRVSLLTGGEKASWIDLPIIP